MTLDRRDFLKVAGAGAGALLTGCASAPGVLRFGRSSANVVVIGAGAFGGWTALNLQRMGAKVTLVDMLGPDTAELEIGVTPPAVVMLVGLQGSGKTTTTAKLAKLLAGAGLEVCIHAFTDGRDTPPRSARQFVEAFEVELGGDGRIHPATIAGRYFAMDRDKRWDRTEKAYRAIVRAEGPRADDWATVLEASYAQDVGDEFVEPHVIGAYEGMRSGDAVLCANFRADRVEACETTDAHFRGEGDGLRQLWIAGWAQNQQATSF